MKSFDIKPKNQSQPRPRKNFSLPKTRPAERKAKAPTENRPHRVVHMGRIIAVVVVILVIIASVFGFLVLPSVVITVQGSSEPLTRDFEINVDPSLSSVDSANLGVPGKIVEEEVNQNKTVQSTGSRNVGKSASGFVQIYNFSKATLILRADTTVLTAGDKEYKFALDVGNIRPTAFIGLENQEIDPSSLIAPVPVIATAPGDQYNLAKDTRFEINNEVFGSKPEELYAIAVDSIAGGTTKNVPIVTEADITNGLDSLHDEIFMSTKDKLTTEDNLTLLDSAFTLEVLQQASSAPPGEEVSEFNVATLARVRGLAFSLGDVRSVIEERIKRLLPENKVLSSPNDVRLQVKYIQIDVQSGRGVLAAHYEGVAKFQLDPTEIAAKVKGRNETEIRELLLSRPEIDSVEVKFSPFWVKKAPRFDNRVEVQVR